MLLIHLYASFWIALTGPYRGLREASPDGGYVWSPREVNREVTVFRRRAEGLLRLERSSVVCIGTWELKKRLDHFRGARIEDGVPRRCSLYSRLLSDRLKPAGIAVYYMSPVSGCRCTHGD